MPPKYIESPPAFFNPEDRIMLMDEQQVDRAMMWPTLASLLEERLADDPKATAVVVHALNEWMHEHWTFNFENRIFATPVINLSIVDEAIRELDYVVERGARADPDPAGAPCLTSAAAAVRSPCRSTTRSGSEVQESGVLVGMHSSDDGYTRYINEWDGIVVGVQRLRPRRSMFSELVGSEYRNIRDTVYSIIGHGLATRFPDLRFMPVENGSQWVPTALKQFQKLYDRDPERLRRGPDGGLPALDHRPPVLRRGRDGHRRRWSASTTSCSARTTRTPRAGRPDCRSSRRSTTAARGRQGQDHGRHPVQADAVRPHREGRRRLIQRHRFQASGIISGEGPAVGWVLRMISSMRLRMSGSSLMSAAAMASSMWAALRVPTMATSTAGLASVQATASWLRLMPNSSRASRSSAATAARLRW